jgi:hypothetical protein
VARRRRKQTTKPKENSRMSEGGKKGNDKSKVEQLLTDLLIGGGVGAIAKVSLDAHCRC